MITRIKAPVGRKSRREAVKRRLAPTDEIHRAWPLVASYSARVAIRSGQIDLVTVRSTVVGIEHIAGCVGPASDRLKSQSKALIRTVRRERVRFDEEGAIPHHADVRFPVVQIRSVRIENDSIFHD